MDIIIFGGQSNMQGQSECLTDTQSPLNCYEYKYLTNEIVLLKNPVGENITCDFKEGYVFDQHVSQSEWLNDHLAGSSCYHHTNLVPSFCDIYAQITGHETLAVHIAKGSTEIAQWLPGSKGYQLLVQKANAARQKASADRIVFVWLQGESDAIAANTKAYYKASLLKLCEALQQDIGIEKFGIIRVGRFTNDYRDEEILSAQDEICLEHADFLMLTAIATELNTQPEYMNPYVNGHFSAKGLEKLGFEAGKTLAGYIIGK